MVFLLGRRESDDTGLVAPCRDLAFEGAAYVVCDVDPADYALSVGHTPQSGDATVADYLAGRSDLLLAMNAGMYQADLSALGLLVERGEEVAPINLRDGAGNFYLKSNGVFALLPDGSARILETAAYVRAQVRPAFATQSGPLLVEDGRIHPAISPNGVSRFIRNGVGVRGDGTVVLAISRDPVSFGGFARLFRDELDCPDALYLDGVVSSLATRNGVVVGGDYPAGPVLAVARRG